jgi:hypothetical protein
VTWRPIAPVLLLAAVLGAVGLRWGLPSAYGWAPDELLPSAVEEAAARRFSGGWHAKYPPVHFAVLAMAQAPVRAASHAAGLDAPAVNHALMLTGRLVSLALALGTLAALYAAARRPFGESSIATSAAYVVTTAPRTP